MILLVRSRVPGNQEVEELRTLQNYQNRPLKIEQEVFLLVFSCLQSPPLFQRQKTVCICTKKLKPLWWNCFFSRVCLIKTFLKGNAQSVLYIDSTHYKWIMQILYTSYYIIFYKYNCSKHKQSIYKFDDTCSPYLSGSCCFRPFFSNLKSLLL